MINILEMETSFQEASWVFLTDSTFANWQTYYFKVCYYYNEMNMDARSLEVKDVVKKLKDAIRFLKSHLPDECYGPYHHEIETLEMMDYYLERHLEDEKVLKKGLFS